MADVSQLKRYFRICGNNSPVIAIYGGSFNPPCNHHVRIPDELACLFDGVIIFPCGMRADKAVVNEINLSDRLRMVELAYADVGENVALDCSDLIGGVFTPTYRLQDRYEKLFPGAELWHVVGGDIVTGGNMKKSEIHRIWSYGEEIWNDFNFAIIQRGGYPIEEDDLPPFSRVIEIPDLVGSGTLVRKLIFQGEEYGNFVPKEVRQYIEEHRLYR